MGFDVLLIFFGFFFTLPLAAATANQKNDPYKDYVNFAIEFWSPTRAFGFRHLARRAGRQPSPNKLFEKSFS
ncbi:MAG: hypothetical protein JSU01_20665 [Bacteroidetes bacterium]|nr:hypothetical protein [Bacteroidota bacterium]